ncbi:3-oxoacyl-[acyl-carrier-protein] reductase FabG [Rosistilla carotiformis]|uniref:3-oxoacyl-[acyl-carrier-protein] reductase FabG n=1 Tax=Rosistilla carotiformis TaxID=2528017 RepID=A0A518JYZ6_9BACT|nr:SDR family oxidoreductase [Rosistilla carotiformis]QDV70764.1 3-oxoacyl-[acyl-carrier-protein] reductase FabG [Rosistilla carotiformis]
MPETDLNGKVAIVFGAARNMGRAFAESLAQRGAAVAVHHRGASSQEDAQAAANQIVDAGGRAIVVAGDLAESATVAQIFDKVKSEFGRVDFVINCAGVVIKKPFVEYTDEDFDRSFDANAKAAFFVMREAAKEIEDDGRIISLGTSLLGAFTGFYGVYAGSKAPLEDFTRALAKEVGGRGVTVNVVAPGPVDTGFFHGEESPESVAYLSAASVANRRGTIQDIVPMIDFLCSPGSAWVTGQILFVNGGFVTR